MNKAVSSRVWHGLLAVVVAVSLIIQVILAAGGDYAPAGTRFIRLVSYFTIQSNLIVLAVAVSLVRHPDRDGRWWRVARLDALLGIIITGLVYATVLAGTAHLTGAAWWSNLGLHYVAPWWALAGWLVFGPRPRITRPTLLWAFVWPVLWIGYTLAHGAATRWFPYPFTDATQIGYGAAIRNMLFVAVLAIVFAALLRLLDTCLPGRGADRAPADVHGAPVVAQKAPADPRDAPADARNQEA